MTKGAIPEQELTLSLLSQKEPTQQRLTSNQILQFNPLPPLSMSLPSRVSTIRPPNLPKIQSRSLKVVDLPHDIIAGRLKHFHEVWNRLSQDKWILQTIQGFRIPLLATPVQRPCQPPAMSKEMSSILNAELCSLLSRGIVVRSGIASPTSQMFVSTVFTIPKKNGEHRLILNLKALNQYVPRQHFKMEGAHMLPDILQVQDWMVKIDLKEAYYAVPVHPDSQGFLSFLWNQTQYQFTCLPFGLSCAPRIFTKVMKPIVGFLRERGVRLIIYIDDILIMAQSQALAYQHLLLTLDVLELVGFLVNYTKSITSPTQEIDFLGLVVNSRTMTLSLPQEKILKIQKEANLLLSSRYPLPIK